MTLVDDLRDVVGARHVLTDPDLRAPYETDWSGRFRGSAAAVVRPGGAEEVAGVLAACRAAGAAVVPQGGNTGLVGGGVPRGGEVVLSLARLDDVGPPDPATGQVEAGAGATLGALQAAARGAGLDAAMDFGARESATLGGIVACDAGGLRALRHGTARARVAGLEAVLGSGTVVRRLSGLLKDNAGLNLPALLIGSEGTLGVVTRVRWRLIAPPAQRVAVLVALDSIDDVVALVGALRTRVPSLEALELLLPEGLAFTCEYLGVPSPVRDAAAYVLAEAVGTRDPTDELAAVVPNDALLADDTADRERLWRLRETLTEAIAAAGIPHKLDVGVPLDRLGEFLERVPQVVAAVAPGARTFQFGHLGDGNVHVNVLGPDPDDGAVDEAVLRLAAAVGGTISAEHGVGAAKARFLALVRSDAEIAAMRAIKDACDPDGLLNPGVMLPAVAR
ncbi:MAG: FAD-binding oxidoreductase [Solirubrobacterales bacterium]